MKVRKANKETHIYILVVRFRNFPFFGGADIDGFGVVGITFDFWDQIVYTCEKEKKPSLPSELETAKITSQLLTNWLFLGLIVSLVHTIVL